jgi:hypothetical protein
MSEATGSSVAEFSPLNPQGDSGVSLGRARRKTALDPATLAYTSCQTIEGRSGEEETA